MDNKTLEILECARISKICVGLSRTESAAKYFNSLEPFDSVEKIIETQNYVREQKELLDRDLNLPLSGLVSLEEIIDKLNPEDVMLEPRELLKVLNFLISVRLCKKFIKDNEKIIPLHAALFEDLKPLPEIEKEIRSKIDENGRIEDDASQELSNIRSGIRRAEANLTKKIQQILNSLGSANVLQENYYTQRSGRYVIPIRASAKGKVKGIIHDASSSGETFFVEPIDLVEPSNEIQNLHMREKDEIRRILVEISAKVRVQRPFLSFNDSLMTKLDVFHAEALFMLRNNLHLPVISETEPLKLFAAHHPLIYLSNKTRSVPIDFRVRPNDIVILITGPNTGGKTTALKTVGLNSWMALCGLPIPASPDSVIPFYREIFVDIGDDQNVTEGLSTFSSHIRNLNRIIQNVNNNALVLLDEIGTATDPQEGGALACAILEKLSLSSRLIVATSHLSALKQWAHTFEKARNASFYLDEQTHSPNYKIVMDIPGSSEALIIAEREGVSRQIIHRAKTFLTKEEKDLGALLLSIQEKDRELGILRTQTAAIKEANEALKSRYEKMIDELKQNEKNLKKKMLDEKEEALRTYKQDLESRIASLPSRKDLSKMRDNIIIEQKVVISQKKQIEKEQLKEEKKLVDKDITPGSKVFIDLLQDIGTLISADFDKNKAVVEIRGKEMTLPADTLRIPGAADINLEKSRQNDLQQINISFKRKGQVPAEIDLHGKRVEDALAEIDRYLSDAALSGLPYVRLCHGHGTGILRRAVHDYLRTHPIAKSFYFAHTNEGGSGVTIVEIK